MNIGIWHDRVFLSILTEYSLEEKALHQLLLKQK